MLILVILPNKIFTALHVDYHSLKNAFIYLFNIGTTVYEIDIYLYNENSIYVRKVDNYFL